MDIVVISEKNPTLTFTFQQGIDDNHIDTLVQYSQGTNDPDITHHTADWKNGNGRFASVKNFHKWQQKKRTIYTLVDTQGILAGIIWFGKLSMPHARYHPNFNPSLYGITYAIRLYGNARGVGLSAPFTRQAILHFKSTPEYQDGFHPGIWLETNVSNSSAIAAYNKLAARQVSEPSTSGRVLFVLPD